VYSKETILEILEAYDLTKSLRSAAPVDELERPLRRQHLLDGCPEPAGTMLGGRQRRRP
jgi:hypothetical protein